MNDFLKSFTVRKAAITVVAFIWLFLQMYIAFVRPLAPMSQNPLHLVFALAIAVLYNPADKKHKGKKYSGFLKLIDIVFLLALLFLIWYFFSQASRIEQRVQYISPLITMDYIAMICLMVILLECVRRTMGNVLLIFCLVFLAYLLFGEVFPGVLQHGNCNLTKLTELMIMGSDGIFGSALNASVNYLYYFILFGAFLAAYGGGQVLIDIGMKVSKKGHGGPAKAAVLSSALMGMTSGSAVANVSTTGVMTIPLMKKTGYTADEAGAIEAVASTGGMVMPPIMGVSAFLMAEIVGMPYGELAFRALIPAIVYYAAIFLLVDFLARKRNLSGVGDADFENVVHSDPILPRLYLMIPILLVIWFIIAGKSLMVSATRGLLAIFILNIVQKVAQKRGMNLREIFECFLSGTKSVAEIAIPTAACGIVIGSVLMSGLATKMSNIIAGVTGVSMLVSLTVAMIGCMLLGMALPAIAAYLTSYVLFVPSLVRLGLSTYIANMFLFYYGIFAQITPPVALAAYTAAGISGGNAWKTGWKAFTYAIVAFLVPFVFVYNPGILLIGTPMEIAYACFLLVYGTFFMVCAISGYCITASLDRMPVRVGLAGIALAIIWPEQISSIVGSIAGAVFLVWFLLTHRKANTQSK